MSNRSSSSGHHVATPLTVLTSMLALGGVMAVTSGCGGGNQRAGGSGGGGGQTSAGSGGRTGTATGGTSGGGAGGSVSINSCSSDQTLNCASPTALPDGHVVDFSTAEWSNTAGKWCDAAGLRGATYSFSGPTVDGGATGAHAQSVDFMTGHNYHLSLTADPGGYAGGGISFDHCVSAASFTNLSFSIAVGTGDITGCSYQVQLQTYEQQSNTVTPAGGCASNCYQFPSSTTGLPTLTTTPQVATVPLSTFTSSATHTMPIPSQIVGIQWQVNSSAPAVDGGTQTGCTVELVIDDVAFTN